MANVRKSSMFGKRTNRINPWSNSKQQNETNPTYKEEMIEIETSVKFKNLDRCVSETMKPAMRRHSIGSASEVNHAHLMATIRRFPQRRHRQPKKGLTLKILEHFLTFLFYSGMSPLKTPSVKQLPKWSVKVQSIVYWFLAMVSVIDALDGVKYCWILFRVDENMLNFITFGYMTANCLTRIYYFKEFATSSDAMSALLESVTHQKPVEAKQKMDDKSKTIAFGIGIVSVLLAGTNTVMGTTSLNEWSIQLSMQSRSFETSETIFVWSAYEWRNKTIDLYNTYGKEFSAITGTFAVLGSCMIYCGTLHACVLMDLWLIVTIQIYFLQLNFSDAIQKSNEENNADYCPLSSTWQNFLNLRNVCNQCDIVVGKLIKLIHLQNMLLLGYFLLQVLKKEPLNAPFLIDLFTILKVSCTYYLAQKLANKNEEYEKCVIECSKRRPIIEIDGVETSVPVILKEMKKYPIGVGRGEFFIDDGFILKFAGFVGSIFVLLSGESGETCHEKN